MTARVAALLLLGLASACHGPRQAEAPMVLDAEPEAAPAPAPAETAVTIEPAREGWIDRGRLDAVLDAGVGAFLGGVRVEAVHHSGRFVGWRVLRYDNPWVDVRPGDVLISVNGAPIETPDQVQALWESLRSADAITATLRRGAETVELRFRVGASDAEAAAP